MAIIKKLQKAIVKTIRDNLLLEPRENVVLAVSGGADSTAMLDVLTAVNEFEQFRCIYCVAHLNHLIRGKEAKHDEEFVQTLAQRYGLKFFSAQVDVPSIAREAKKGLEETARSERYRFLRKVAEEFGAGKIAVAHTADDNAETVLHRILRGTGMHGLRCIMPRRRLSPDSDIALVRPLIHCWRSEIEEYLAEKGADYVEDSTNSQQLYTRNKIRLELLPYLEREYNVNVKQMLTQLASTAGQVDEFLTGEAIKAIAEGQVGQLGDRIVVDREWLAGQPVGLREAIIAELNTRVWQEVDEEVFDGISYQHYQDIVALAKEGQTGKVLELPSGLRVERGYGTIVFSKREEARETIEFPGSPLTIPGSTEIGRVITDSISTAIRAEVTLIEGGQEYLEEFRHEKLYRASDVQTDMLGEEIFDFDKITSPLVVRGRRDGDRFWPLGAPGERKLKEFLIDEKVPRRQRSGVPILTMSVGDDSDASAKGAQAEDIPIWVVGWRIDDRVKVTPQTTHIMKIAVHSGE